MHTIFRLQIFSILFLLILDSCGNKALDNPDPAHNSRNSLDWEGHYLGTLPCADCEGIKTHLYISSDMTFTYETAYIGKDNSTDSVIKGKFDWSADGNSIKLAVNIDEIPGLYKVGENRLYHLDKDGKMIEGQLAEKYILDKIEIGILNHAWKPIKIRGFSGDFPEDRYPYFQIIKSGTNVVGLNGCNRISAKAVVNEENGSLSFSNFLSTKMACFGADVETPFNTALESSKKYRLTGSKLDLLSDTEEVVMTCVPDWINTEL